MIASWYKLLAAEDDLGILVRLLPLLIILVLGLLSRIFSKVKERHERERAEREEQEYEREHRARQAQQGGAQPRRPTPAQQAVAALRAVLTGTEEETQAPSAPPAQRGGQPQQRPVLRQATGKPRRLRERPLGAGVLTEVGRLERGLEAEETQRRERIGGLGLMGLPAAAGSSAGAGGLGVERRQVRVGLGNAAEARRAIIYSEILGLPKALREGPEPWER